MSHDLARVATLIFNRPLLVLPDTAVTIASNLAERLGVTPMREPGAAAAAAYGRSGEDEDKPYELVGGAAIIPVRGELVNRGSWLSAESGLTSYEALGAALRDAEADPAARGVVLDVDSPGGEAAGAMETAAIARAVSKTKPVTACVNACACSAAYAIAAGADEIVMTPSAIVGSIGVVWLHMDYSAALAEAGVKPTLIDAPRGGHKTDGSAMKPLAPAAMARIQTTIDSYYVLFVDSVGKHRPALGAQGARDTKAGLFLGREAVAAGLADRVGTLDDAIAGMARVSPAGTRLGAEFSRGAAAFAAAMDRTAKTPSAPPPARGPRTEGEREYQRGRAAFSRVMGKERPS